MNILFKSEKCVYGEKLNFSGNLIVFETSSRKSAEFETKVLRP